MKVEFDIKIDDYFREISDLKGKTLSHVKVIKSYGEHYILFMCTDGENYLMFHNQSCCETVTIDEIHGDIENLIGSEIVMAEEVEGESPGYDLDDYESYTWTFYKLATAKGYVTIRWFGESNGYYSESVDFAKVILK